MKSKALSVITNKSRTLSVKQSAGTSGGRELTAFINALLLREHVRYTAVELKIATELLQSDAFCCSFLSTV